MHRRVIPLRISDEYVRGDGVPVGAAGSHDDVALRLVFGPMWAGTARSIVWYDANGENPTITVLTTDMLAEGESEVYIVPIPAAPKAKAGQMHMTIKGATVSGGQETTATLTTTARFTVMESDWSEDAEAGGDITATQAQQLQAEIENIKAGIVDAKAAGAAAAKSEQAAAVSEAAAAESAGAAAGSAGKAASSEAAAAGSAGAAESARSVAEGARDAALTAQQAAENARQGAETAQGKAESARDTAAEAAQAAKNDAAGAAASAQKAAESKNAALNSANWAEYNADIAEGCKASAEAALGKAQKSALDAESWAVGGTGSRPGEDVNNARYWAEQAEAVVGGDFATRQEAQGYVSTHDQSNEAHADLRKAQSDLRDALIKKADLVDGKVSPSQLPDIYDEQGTAQSKVSEHNLDEGAHQYLLNRIGSCEGSAQSAQAAAEAAQATADAAQEAVSGVIHTIGVIPFQYGTLTYNGQAQSPVFNAYNPAALTIGGTTSGTNVGSYTATFAPKSGYRWADGTTAPRSVSWAISKAAGSLSISPAGMTLDKTARSKTITVTRSGDGAISASSNNTGAATVSVSGNTVTVTGKANGSAVVTVSVAEDSNHTAPADKTCAVTVVFWQDDFASNDWGDIIAACQNGLVPGTWAAGSRKAMTIGGAEYMVDIIGKNHDTYTAGGKAPLTFQLHTCYGETKSMNGSDTNSGGWTDCTMRKTHLPAILALMPAEVQSGIREVNKLTSAGSQSSTIVTTADKLFPLSEIEIFGSITKSTSGEGTQYDYYKAGNSVSRGQSYWERSPSVSDATRFCDVNYNSFLGAGANHALASSELGVAFAFCF